MSLLLCWVVGGTLFYTLGLPRLLGALNHKAQSEAYGQCVDQLRAQHMIGNPDSLLTPQKADSYCHCMSDRLILTKNDLFDRIRQRPMAALSALSARLADECNAQLEKETSAPTPAADPNSPDAEGLIHL